MVESTNVRAAEMTMKLSAVNRWCVTGTPVQRQLLGMFNWRESSVCIIHVLY